jgi:O-Antigen ligase
LNTRTLSVLPSHMFMALFAGLCLGYVDIYLFDSGAISYPAAYIFLGLLVFFGIGLVIQSAVSARLRAEIIAMYTAHVSVLVAFGGMVVCAFVYAMVPGAKWDEGPTYLLSPVYDSLVVFFAMLLPVRPHHRRHFEKYVLCGFAVFLASVAVDAYRPGTLSPIPDRAAGFGQNPNITAFVLLLLCASVIDFHRPRPRDVVVITLTSAGVLTTLSRGGGVLLVFLVAYYASCLVLLNRLRAFRHAAAVGILLVLICGVGFVLLHHADIFALSYQPRLGMFDGAQELVPLDDDRIVALKASVDLIKQSPVLGYGTGYSASMTATPHNMFLLQWINSGLAGVIAYVFLLGTAFRLFWRRRFHRGLVFTGLITLNSFFSHNLLEERAFLALLGVLLTISFYEVGACAPRVPASATRTQGRRPWDEACGRRRGMHTQRQLLTRTH